MQKSTDYISAQYSKEHAVNSIRSIWYVASFGYATSVFLYFYLHFAPAILLPFSILYILITSYHFHLINYHRHSNLLIEYFDSRLHTPKLFKGTKIIDLNSLNSIEKIKNTKHEFGVLIGFKKKQPFHLQRIIFKEDMDYFSFTEILTKLVTSSLPDFEHESKTRLSIRQNDETFVLAILCIFFIIIYLTSSSQANFFHITDDFVFIGSNQKGIFKTGEYYRLFTAFFLHIGILHLFLNILILSLYGQFIIRTLGSVRFITILLLSSFFGTLGSNLFSSAIYSIGASGGLYGLIGTYIYLKTKYDNLLPASINSISTKFLVSLLIADLIFSIFIFENIDFINHIFGFSTGIAYCYLTNTKLITIKTSSSFEKSLCFVLSIIYLTSLLFLFIKIYH